MRGICLLCPCIFIHHHVNPAKTTKTTEPIGKVSFKSKSRERAIHQTLIGSSWDHIWSAHVVFMSCGCIQSACLFLCVLLCSSLSVYVYLLKKTFWARTDKPLDVITSKFINLCREIGSKGPICIVYTKTMKKHCVHSTTLSRQITFLNRIANMRSLSISGL